MKEVFDQTWARAGPEPAPGQVQARPGLGPARSRPGPDRPRADFYQQKINKKLKSLGHFGDVRGGVGGVFLNTFGNTFGRKSDGPEIVPGGVFSP